MMLQHGVQETDNLLTQSDVGSHVSLSVEPRLSR